MRIFTILAETSKLNPGDIGYSGVTDAANPLQGLLNTAYAWGAIIAIIVIVIAGYLFTTSNGDSSQVTRARNAIVAAAVGLIVIASAFVITQFIIFRAT